MANDASSWQKNYATMLRAMGYPVWVCDGVADDVEMLAAIAALPASGGRIVLSEGNFYIANTIVVNKENVILCGQGFNTKIYVSAAMTYSFSLDGAYGTIEDMYIYGESLAEQFYVNSSYWNMNRVWITGHTVYNLHCRGVLFRAEKCFFIGKPVYAWDNVLTFDTCYFNGDGTEYCLIIPERTGKTFINCTFESFAGYGIIIGSVTTANNVNFFGGYMETSFTTTAAIHVISTRSLAIIGMESSSSAYVTDDLLVDGWCQDFEFKGNTFNQAIVLEPTSAEAWDVQHRYGLITYRSQILLNNVRIEQDKSIIWLAAAPTTGTWVVGDQVWHTDPAFGEAIGWICSVAGTPGTWDSMGELPGIISDSQPQANTYVAMYATSYPRVGSYFTSFPIATIYSFGVYLYKIGSPTGTLSITVRKASDDTLLGTIGTQDVSLLTGDPVLYEYDTTPVANTALQDIRVSAEYSEAGSNILYVAIRIQNTDVKSGVQLTRYSAGGVWAELATSDLAYTVEYGSIAADSQNRVVSGIAGTALAYGDLVYLASADNKWELADADAESTAKPVLGICLQVAVADGDATKILLEGQVTAEAVFPPFTVGDPVYVSTYAGVVSVTAPSGTGDIVRIVGYGLSADELYFSPDPTYIKLL